jgi:hypothetical protein
MDFMIPSWALGVGIIIIAGSMAKAISAGLIGVSRRKVGGRTLTSPRVTDSAEQSTPLQHRLAKRAAGLRQAPPSNPSLERLQGLSL